MLAAPSDSARNDTSLLSADLQADGQALPEGGVLILLVSLPDCHWCHEIRSRYLLPIHRDRDNHRDLRIREIRLTGDDTVDFDGRRKDIEAIAARWSVQVAPTVLFLDRCGSPLTEALIGGDVAGFYGAYFDRALAAARALARATPIRDC